ncbi:MAG: hypothetical protein KGJ57_03735 [Sphingomonadales bacterium]|nr:hypothetical protein [Sphingomonadales bacterium]MDE2168522.1 hypothetical protein [Sphingomonadales bacterium]
MLPAVIPEHAHRPSSARHDRHRNNDWSKRPTVATSAYEGMRTVDTIGASYEKYPRYVRVLIIIALTAMLWTVLFMGTSALLSAI